VYCARIFRVFQSIATMPTKIAGVAYLVESKFFSTAVLRSCHANLPINDTKSRLVKMQV
jgi:hypothetical protein